MRRLNRYSASQRFGRLHRRFGWLLEAGITPSKAANIAKAGAAYAVGAETMRALPVVLKIDIAPACNLRCVSCLHADPRFAGDDPIMADQDLSGRKRMSLASYRRILDEVRGRSSAISLYYYGDPLVHPELVAMCTSTWEAGLSSHVSTNLSFRLDDRKIAALVSSGLTHLTVCVDGIRQDTYAATRVGGRLDVVLDNLRRICLARESLGRRHPRIEVQFVKFRHNVAELGEVEAVCQSWGVDQVTSYWGSLHNPSSTSVERYVTGAPLPARRALPRCTFPWSFMTIKYDGNAIPCCAHRTTSQYRRSPSADPRHLGNVLESSVEDVWNSPAYRSARRLARRPDRQAATGVFCEGCPRLFQTTKDEGVRSGRDHSVWDVYPEGPEKPVHARRSTA